MDQCHLHVLHKLARPLLVSGGDYLERCLQTAPRQVCKDICNVLVSLW
jgi:hypothetical protein